MNKLRILALVHDHLVPPGDVTGVDVREAEWKMEYDVTETLKEMGHDVLVLGVHDELAGIRPTVSEFQPHIVFNLMEAFASVPDVRPERCQLPRATSARVHGLQSRAA